MNELNKIGYIFNEYATEVDDIEIQDSKNSRRVRAKGRVQTGNEKNRNGRRYNTSDLAREIAAPRQKELLSTGNMLGEAGHPLSKDLVRQQTIDPTNVCVRYLKFWMEGDDVMAIFEGTNNALGETFDLDLRSGVKPAFSLRALGTVVSTKEGALVQNLKIVTYDYVIFPSHPGAYTVGLVNESSIYTPQPKRSGFSLNTRPNMDGTKSLTESFSNGDVISIMKSHSSNESAIDYIKDKSFNYHMLKECFDMTKIDTVDMISNNKIALTESGSQTIVMNVEDYIAKEIQNYR